MIAKILSVTTLAILATGCATSFTGDPHVADGRSGCQQKCSGQGMQLVGMVFMGEYTSGCVCGEPGKAASADRQLFAAAEAAAGAGAAGVVMQMRAQQQRQQH